MNIKTSPYSHPHAKVDAAWFQSYKLDPLRGKRIQLAGVTPWDIRNPAHYQNTESSSSILTQAGTLKRLSLDLPENLYRRIQLIAAAKGMTVSEFLNDLIQHHFPE